MIKTKRLFLLFFLPLVLRLWGILTRPIWYDEAFSIFFSSKGLGAMLVGTLTVTDTGAADIHPVGYYTLLWGWMKIFGESLLATRLLSVFIGVGIVFLGYFIMRYLFNEKAAFWAAFFLAISPFQIHYSQEIRMYALMTFWLLIALYAFLKGVLDESWTWLGIFSLSAALAQYTHHLAAFFLLPLSVTAFFFRGRKGVLRAIIGGCVAIILYLPWLIHLPSQLSKVQTSYWVPKPGVEKFVTVLLSYVTNLPLSNDMLLLALFITFFLVAFAFFQTLRCSRCRKGMWLLFLAFSPPVLLFLFSQWTPIFIERALLPSGAIFSMWIAWVASETKMPRFLLALFLGFMGIGAGLGLYQHLTYQDFPYAPYQDLLDYVMEEESTLIVHSNKLSFLPAVYYAPELKQNYVADKKGGADTLAIATQKVLGLLAEPSVEAAVGDADRVCFIIFEQSIEEYQEIGYLTHPHLEWLESNYSLEDKTYWNDLALFTFVRTQE